MTTTARVAGTGADVEHDVGSAATAAPMATTAEQVVQQWEDARRTDAVGGHRLIMATRNGAVNGAV